LVKGESLAEIGYQLDLGKYLGLGPGELRSGGQSRGSILADAIEAIFAAVYFDGGYFAARQLILNLFKEKLAAINTAAQLKDPKTLLQEYLQGKKCELPVYTVISITGEQHDQLFTVTCEVKAFHLKKQGEGCSRRKAEQHAADLCMRHFDNG
jgi:ribonuclease-3